MFVLKTDNELLSDLVALGKISVIPTHTCIAVSEKVILLPVLV